MRMELILLAAVAITASAAMAGSQSSNSSSNSSTNNGVVSERVVETDCEDGRCQRYLLRRLYRDDEGERRYRERYSDDDG
ncbi:MULTISPECIES: hypothetical protein [unclassified Sinorhizobium]|uniref:hypothetical protein n=1 Tax=unclassified Sinorhizobium TaxID=2613772 RepID=UPI0024C2F368|nr:MULTISPECIES: hypothetical protein [unclassified Sinorhizobium]MDK1373288.1 hypothetical protein [Sinorhizobium sp. 6-70]MDK1482649.1 hypothetical protein [Sinorhizobium sp. 6-117]